MTFPKEITFVTGNKHKFIEIKKLLEEEFPNLKVLQKNVPLIEPQADSLEEIAKFKAESALKYINPPFFIEDAGFFVDDFCKGFPGVYSSYVMKTIGYEGILRIMKNEKKRRAHFASIIVYIDENGKIKLFSGDVYGKVSEEAKGLSGFGFDPIFIPDEKPEKTFAELDTKEKNTISHRSKAFKKLINYLKS